MIRKSSVVSFLVLLSCLVSAQEPSTCYGTAADGSLNNGGKLPSSGANYSVYSSIGSMIGRTYVHSEVYAVVVDAYFKLEKSLPKNVFVYGESGKKRGGEFDPHKTHRNGLSVDFMVPVVDQSGESVPLPASVLNK